MVPTPKNSLETARKIQKPQAIAHSQKKLSILSINGSQRTCLTTKSPKIQVIIHIPVLSTGIPRAVKPRRNTEAHKEAVPILTHKYTLHLGTRSFSRFFKASAKTVVSKHQNPCCKGLFHSCRKQHNSKANASAGYFNFISYPPLFLFHCLQNDRHH